MNSLTRAESLRLLPPNRSNLFTGASSQIIARWRLTKESGLILFYDGESSFAAPYTNERNPRRAVTSDGVSIALLAAIANGSVPKNFTADFTKLENYSTEREALVDQTNESIILDSKAILKWQIQPDQSVGAQKEALLSKNNFTSTPKLLGQLFFGDLLVASLNEYIPDSTDGWTWCVEKAATSEDGQWVEELADLTFGMHEVFLATKDLTQDGVRKTFVHGDFHVGQILATKASKNLSVIDFDGDPLLSYAERMELQTPLVDIASMLCSFYHVGAVAIKGGTTRELAVAWIESVQEQYISRYFSKTEEWGLPPRSELLSLMLRHEAREFEYAKKFLPHWIYAPTFAIDCMKEFGYGFK